MTEAERRSEIARVARATVARVAPEELPRFRLTTEAYFKDPAAVLCPPRQGDSMLGFGTGMEVQFLTPLVLHISSLALSLPSVDSSGLVAAAGSAVTVSFAKEVLKEVVHEVYGQLRTSARSPAPSPQFSREQTELLSQLAVALERAKDAGLARERVEQVVDAVDSEVRGSAHA